MTAWLTCADLNESRFKNFRFCMVANINTNRRVAIRVAQLDYIPVRTRPAWTHDIRVMTGVVFRLGS